jgi:hemoglobin
MKKDIQDRKDIELLINSFYDKVKVDDKIGFIFNDIIGSDWSHHLPVMYQFWDMVLFTTPGYAGNPTKKHVDIDAKIKLEKEHFDKWLELWNGTIDALFEGEKAEEAKNRGALMAHLINMKIEMSRDGNLIQ